MSESLRRAARWTSGQSAESALLQYLAPPGATVERTTVHRPPPRGSTNSSAFTSALPPNPASYSPASQQEASGTISTCASCSTLQDKLKQLQSDYTKLQRKHEELSANHSKLWVDYGEQSEALDSRGYDVAYLQQLYYDKTGVWPAARRPGRP
jgi:hypothetical protein